LSCAYIENSAPAASVAFPKGVYRVELSRPIKDLAVPETITVIRKKKEKVLSVDDFLVGDVIVEGASVTFELESHNTGSLRADVFIQACLEKTHLDGDVRIISITRIAQEE
ncbi:MAG: radical SAM protein, partial [Eggerthellaceae bacterium]|nr:radical SAM protein [Eggerthellaceae bacterium]